MFELSKQGSVNLLISRLPLTTEHVEEAIRFVEPLLGTGQPRLVMSLEHVTLIDSQGLECLLDWKDACAAQGGDLRLYAPNELCEEILRITQVDQSFDIFADSLTAIGSYAR